MKLISTLIVIVLTAVSALAQEKAISQEEFDQALTGTDQHKIKWQGQSYRTRVETSVTIVDKPDADYSSNIMIEFGPNRTSRSVLTDWIRGQSTTQETLSVDDKSYSRKNGGPWVTNERKASPAPDRKPDGADPVATISADATYTYLGERPYKDATATVYRKVENTKRVNSSTAVEMTSLCTSEYWLVDGLERKQTRTCRHNRPTETSTTAIVHTWDLDPTIVIKAP